VSELVQLHVAEYQALTARNTSWQTLQAGLGPLLLLFYALVAQVWQSQDHATLVWVSVLVLEFVSLVFCQAALEGYNNVRYLETKLRPALVEVLGTNAFWMYERWIPWHRPGVVWWYEASPAGFSLLALGAAVYWCSPANPLGWLAFAAGAGMLLLLAVISTTMIRTRREYERAA